MQVQMTITEPPVSTSPALSCSVSPDGLQYAEDVEEQVDEVEVEVDRGENILLRRQLVHDQVGVENDEATKDHGSRDRQHKLQRFAPEQSLHGSWSAGQWVNDSAGKGEVEGNC